MLNVPCLYNIQLLVALVDLLKVCEIESLEIAFNDVFGYIGTRNN